VALPAADACGMDRGLREERHGIFCGCGSKSTSGSLRGWPLSERCANCERPSDSACRGSGLGSLGVSRLEMLVSMLFVLSWCLSTSCWRNQHVSDATPLTLASIRIRFSIYIGPTLERRCIMAIMRISSRSSCSNSSCLSSVMWWIVHIWRTLTWMLLAWMLLCFWRR